MWLAAQMARWNRQLATASFETSPSPKDCHTQEQSAQPAPPSGAMRACGLTLRPFCVTTAALVVALAAAYISEKPALTLCFFGCG
jgi:hypothetical protein